MWLIVQFTFPAPSREIPCSCLILVHWLVTFWNNFLGNNYSNTQKRVYHIQAGLRGNITVPNEKPDNVPHHPYMLITPVPLPSSPLTEPWASSCWLNFPGDVRVHVHRPCKWCFWMNECPLPPPILVLRDVYKSRSPGQPAELHDMRSEAQVPEAKFKKIKIRHIFFLQECSSSAGHGGR